MRHLRPQFAILDGAFTLAVLVSLFASKPAFYQKLSLATHALVPVEKAANHCITVFDLRQPSLAAEFNCVVRLVARLPGGALKLTRSTEDGSEFGLQLPMEMFTSGR